LSGSVMMSHRAVPELDVAEAGLGGIRPGAGSVTRSSCRPLA
jgi:hypothetical protein